MGAQISNNSWAGGGYSQVLSDAITPRELRDATDDLFASFDALGQKR